jgi:hypothetical protein
VRSEPRLALACKIPRNFIRGRRSGPKIVPFRLLTAGNGGSDRIVNHMRNTGNHMDSINQQQPEQNRVDLSGAKAIQKMKQLVDEAETCFFCTGVISDGSTGTRPMSVQEVDEQGNLWFLSADDSHKNEELSRDPSVRLYFQGSAHSVSLHSMERQASRAIKRGSRSYGNQSSKHGSPKVKTIRELQSSK